MNSAISVTRDSSDKHVPAADSPRLRGYDANRPETVFLVIACLYQGGTEMQTLHTARSLTELGYAVRLLCLFEWCMPVREAFEAAGATVECLELPSPRNYSMILWRVSRRIRSLRPAFVHVQYIAPGLLSVVAARVAGVRRVLITVHQEGTACTWFQHVLFRVATRLAKLTICVSRAAEGSWLRPQTQKWIPRLGPHTVVHNCVELAASPSDVPITAPRLWTIGYVGRVRREKGVDILLHAISILAANGGDFRLVVVGDGPQLAECQELAADLRMASRISWLGVISPQELPSHYRSFDVLAVPSRSEGFGLVAVEAMAQGVPVVAARVGGLPEIVADGLTGLLFEPGNEYDLAHQLETLMANRVLVRQLAGAARERAAQCFSRDRYRTSLDQIYRALTR